MLKRFALACGAAAVLAASPAAAETTIYYEGNPYHVMRTPEDRTCGLIALFGKDAESRTLMLVEEADMAGGTSMLIVSVGTSPLPEGTGPITLQVDFVQEDAVDASGDFGQHEFVQLPRKKGGHTFFAEFDDAGERAQIRSNFASFYAVGFHHGDTLLTAMPLEGADVAMAKMEECLASFG